MKTRWIVLTAAAGMLLLLVSACGIIAEKDPLDGTSWTLTAYQNTKPIEGTTLTAEFSDGQIRGSAGCNSYFASYEVNGDSITIGDAGWTLMACMDPEGVMEQEQIFIQSLQGAQHFTLEDGQLMIFQSDGEALTFTAQ